MMKTEDFSAVINAELEEAKTVLDRFLSDQHNHDLIASAAKLMAHALANNGKIIACGNGGSHCDAMHFAEELTGRFRDDRKPLPALAISDPAYLTCAANDYGFEEAFARFVEGLGQSQDLLLAISTSGNSSNVIKAIQAAKSKGMKTIGLTGNDGGQVAAIVDMEIRVPHTGYADRIQEVHIKIIHILIALIEKLKT